MKRLSWKAINTWIMFGLLLAPGLYLFGGYIGQLAGSHGEFMYAEPAVEGGIDYSVEYNGETYERIFYTNWYAYDLSLTDDDYLNIGVNSVNNKNLIQSSFIVWSETNIDKEDNQGISFHYYWYGNEPYYELENQLNNSGINVCFSFWQSYFYDNASYLGYYEIFVKANQALYGRRALYVWNSSQHVYVLDDEDPLYGMPNLYEAGHIATSYGLLSSTRPEPAIPNRVIPVTQPSIESAPAIEQNAQGNTEFQQGQFFSRNNFLKKWGDSVVNQEETWGFAPFKALIQYLDENMLHFAPNGVQYGLMAYGYMYYALHIVLLDLVFFVASFFPRFIKKIVEKLEGGIE